MAFHDSWYEVIGTPNGVLRQGDIIRGQTLFAPASNCDVVFAESGSGVAKAITGDWIILNNSCDLQNLGRTPYVLTAAVAPLEIRLARFGEGDRLFVAEAWRRRMVRDPYILAPHPDSGFPMSLVNLREVIATPSAMILRWAERTAPRLRLKPPFREAFSGAIAEQVAWVGIEDAEAVPRFTERFYPPQQVRAADLAD